MGTRTIIWNVFKKAIPIALVGITVTDRYAGVCRIRGSSMSPTFNPSLGSFTDDYAFLEKFCLDKYKFTHGDVVIFSDPTDFKERCVKRIVAMEGEYISNMNGAIKVPDGHCWVEGDNSASSCDSRSFGPILPRCPSVSFQMIDGIDVCHKGYVERLSSCQTCVRRRGIQMIDDSIGFDSGKGHPYRVAATENE